MVNSDVAQKKIKKRMQLKNLIVTKFKNKYCTSLDSSDNLNKLIDTEIDTLFSMDNFDERDLVASDRRIR